MSFMNAADPHLLIHFREVRIHFLSLASGTLHPGATEPVIRIASEQGRVFLTQMYRQYVGWLVWPVGSSNRIVEIWNWQTGSLVWVSYLRIPR